MAKLSNTKGLSKVEKACIKGLVLDTDYDSGQIANTLGREVELVDAYIVELKQAEVETPAVVSENLDEVQSKKDKNTYYINKTMSGKPGIVVSTETASMRADANYSQRIAESKTPSKEYVHKIHD